MTVGPTVTRYELELGPGVKVARVTSLHKDIAYAMAVARRAHPRPDPRPQAIGVEVPNRQRQLVAARRHPRRRPRPARPPTRSRWPSAATSPAGRCWPTWPTMPHILIAGATGAGKSSLHQLAHHVDPDALDARPGAA